MCRALPGTKGTKTKTEYRPSKKKAKKKKERKKADARLGSKSTLKRGETIELKKGKAKTCRQTESGKKNKKGAWTEGAKKGWEGKTNTKGNTTRSKNDHVCRGRRRTGGEKKGVRLGPKKRERGVYLRQKAWAPESVEGGVEVLGSSGKGDWAKAGTALQRQPGRTIGGGKGVTQPGRGPEGA